MKIELNQQQQPLVPANGNASGKITDFLIQKKIAKNARQAEIILISFVVIGFLITAYLFTRVVGEEKVDQRYIYDPAIHDGN